MSASLIGTTRSQETTLHFVPSTPDSDVLPHNVDRHVVPTAMYCYCPRLRERGILGGSVWRHGITFGRLLQASGLSWAAVASSLRLKSNPGPDSNRDFQNRIDSARPPSLHRLRPPSRKPRAEPSEWVGEWVSKIGGVDMLVDAMQSLACSHVESRSQSHIKRGYMALST